jgi:hypothetical protein
MVKYYCKTCDKHYASRQSLHNHKKKYHNTPETVNKSINSKKVYNVNQKSVLSKSEVSQKSVKSKYLSNHNYNENQDINGYKCKYCGRIYKHKQSKYNHLKNCEERKLSEECKLDNKLVKKSELMENELICLKRENKLIKKENKQLNKICNLNSNNKNLSIRTQNNNINTKNINNSKNIQNTKNINNSKNIQNTNIQNNIINIVPLGKEELQCIFTDDEQVEVLKRQYNSLQHLIFKIYNDEKFSKYRNVAIKNMKDDYAYQYNECNDDFELVSKSAVILDLINEHTMTIQHFLDYNAGKLSKRVLNRLNTFLNTIEDINTKTYKDNVEAINILLYNATKRYKVIMNIC